MPSPGAGLNTWRHEAAIGFGNAVAVARRAHLAHPPRLRQWARPLLLLIELLAVLLPWLRALLPLIELLALLPTSFAPLPVLRHLPSLLSVVRLACQAPFETQ